MAQDGSLVTEIDPDGDVFLQPRATGEQKSLLVSSHVLALASPTFAAMFKPRFQEGSPSPAQKKPIPLPEDDADALILFCYTIHHRPIHATEPDSASCLMDLAIICDKYCCVPSLQYAMEAWIDRAGAGCSGQDWYKLLFAAYVMDLPRAFSRISWHVLNAHTGPFTHSAGVTDHSLIREELPGTYFESR